MHPQSVLHHRQQADGLPERDDNALVPRRVDVALVVGCDVIDVGCRWDVAFGINVR